MACDHLRGVVIDAHGTYQFQLRQPVLAAVGLQPVVTTQTQWKSNLAHRIARAAQPGGKYP